MIPERIVSFILVATLLVAVPGPSVLFIVGRALALGRRMAMLTAIGNAGGVLGIAGIVIAGLGPILQRSETLLLIVKFAGAIYLVVLGARSLRSAGRLHGRGGLNATTITATTPVRILREGFLVGLMNPKALVFFSAILPQFVDIPAGDVPAQLAILAVLLVGIGLVVDLAWAITAGSARAWFSRDARRLRGITRAGGVVMIGLGGGLFVEASRD